MVLLQSCSVYSSRSCSVDEAIRNDSKVKIRVPDNDPYVLKKLAYPDGIDSNNYHQIRNEFDIPDSPQNSWLNHQALHLLQ